LRTDDRGAVGVSAPGGYGDGSGGAAEGATRAREARGSQGRTGRRRFISLIAAAGAAVASAIAAIPFLGMVLAPARGRDGRIWRDVGPVSGFAVGSTTMVTYPDPAPDPWSGLAVRNAAWLRRESEDGFTAFTVYCTHTGCPVQWHDRANVFLCPCHGGVFDRHGRVTAGPPPRPLEQPPVRIREGRVEVLATGVPTPG
jgi:menaquinol-cytochrome c reductase iron-sulfur subunit